MRLRAILREAGRNIASGAARTVLLASLLSIVTTGLVAAELLAVRTISDDALRYQRSGASIMTITAPGRIDGAACDALATVPNARASGAVRSMETGIAASTLPSSTIPLFEVTGGFPDLLDPQRDDAAGVYLSRDAANALGVESGEEFPARFSAPVAVAGVYEYPSDGRRSGFGYAALAPAGSNGRFDECWVDVWPTSDEIPALMQTTLASGGENAEPPALAQLNPSLGRAFDGAERFEQRITRFAAGAAGATALGLGFVAMRTRRLQLASAMHAGMKKTDLACISGLEVLSWVAPAVVFSGMAAAAFAVSGIPADAPSAAVLGLRIITPAAVFAFLGAGVALAATRETHLFRYFKNR